VIPVLVAMDFDDNGEVIRPAKNPEPKIIRVITKMEVLLMNRFLILFFIFLFKKLFFQDVW